MALIKRNPLCTVDLLLYGNPCGTTWKNALPDQQGLVNAANYVKTAFENEEWIQGTLRLMEYFPNPEVEDILLQGRFQNDHDIVDLCSSLRQNIGDYRIKTFGKLKDRIKERHLHHGQIDQVLKHINNIHIISTYDPADAKGLSYFLDVTLPKPPVERLSRLRDLFSYIEDDKTFFILMNRILSSRTTSSAWETISFLHYKGLVNHPELGMKSMFELSKHLATDGTWLMPEYIIPKSFFDKLPTNALLALFCNSPCTRRLESFPELSRYAAPWIFKQMGKKELYQLACLKSTAVKHTPMSEYRKVLDKVEKAGLVTDIYMLNHLFYPNDPKAILDFMKTDVYNSFPQEIKVSESAMKLCKNNMENSK